MPFQSSAPGSRRTTKPLLIMTGCAALIAVGAAGGSAAVTLLREDQVTSLAAQSQTTKPSTALASTATVPPATMPTTPAATTTSQKAAKPTRVAAPTPSITPHATSRPASTPKTSATKPKNALPIPTRVTTKASAPTETPDSFDDSYARTVAGYIVEDVATADERFSDHPGIGASTTMDFLSEDMGRLLDAGMPPVKDQAHYYALVTTLEKFYSKAANQLPDDVMGAAATYTVARENTGELLSLLNPVLGTKYKLGQWSFM